MATTIEQQVALDEALVPSTKRLRIGRSNFRLPSNIQSKEPTLQVVYDVLRGCPFFKAFLIAIRVKLVRSIKFEGNDMWDLGARSHGEVGLAFGTMATTIEQQVALDEALVPSTQMLRIGRSNFRLPSDIHSKESTLQVVYDVLHQSLFFKAFLVTPDAPKIYIQELWGTATVHQHSIRFKMDTRKHIFDLESFREMLHISPRAPGQSFSELPFEEEILEFLRDDIPFSTIKVVSRDQNTQQYGAILPIELTTEDIRNTKAYK
nr:hypothetical protein [Tanacetum cinerariifolium]